MDSSNNKSCLGVSFSFLGIGVSILWLLNLTLGVFEIPDNLPIIGNIDEAFFSWVFFASLSYLGFHFVPFRHNDWRRPPIGK